MFRLPINTVVQVKGIIEPGKVIGYHGNDCYIIGWDETPQSLDSFACIWPDNARAMVIYNDTVCPWG
jgi:hypothetical protein